MFVLVFGGDQTARDTGAVQNRGAVGDFKTVTLCVHPQTRTPEELRRLLINNQNRFAQPSSTFTQHR